MDDPIEIVARAIRAEMDKRQGTVPDVDAYFRALARAALLALRGMDGRMWMAGRDEFVRRADAFHAADRYEMASAIADRSPEHIFQAMIDAALGSQTQEKGNE